MIDLLTRIVISKLIVIGIIYLLHGYCTCISKNRFENHFE